MIKKILFFCFLFFSNVASAEDYPAIFVSASSIGPSNCHTAFDASQINGYTLFINASSGYVECYLYNGSLYGSGVLRYYDRYTCPGGGSLSTTNPGNTCLSAPACTAPQVRSPTTGICNVPPPSCKSAETLNVATNSCVAPVCTASQINDAITGACITPSLPICTGTQSAFANQCQYPKDKGLPINCSDGSTVYVPMACPPVSRWQDVFPPPKHMCSPLDTVHTACTPTLFQRFDDFASSHAIQYATAAIALASVGTLTAGTALVAGVATEGKMLWDGVFHNSSGEIVDFKVAADVPKPVMGGLFLILLKLIRMILILVDLLSVIIIYLLIRLL